MPSAAFFASVRKSLFGGSIPQSAVDAINAIAATWTDSQVLSDAEFAYVLATVYHECGAGMLLETESFAYSAARMLQVWPSKLKSLADAQTYVGQPEKLANHVYAGVNGNGNEASGDGFRFCGRGWPQLTGRANYSNFSQLIGINLVANPDALLQPSVSAKVLITGMLEGTFTGKKLGDYFTKSKQDATHARAIVNGDTATNGAKVARYWGAFRAALAAADPKPAVTASPAVAPQPNLLETIKMDISLWTLVTNAISLLPYLRQDIATEVKVTTSTEDGKAKALQTIAVIEDMCEQAKAVINGTAIPAATAKAP